MRLGGNVTTFDDSEALEDRLDLRGASSRNVHRIERSLKEYPSE